MIIKSVDPSGRIVIPVDLLRSAGIERGDSVELYSVQYDGYPSVLITKYQDTCICCGTILESGKFKTLMGRRFCLECMKRLKKEINKQDKQLER